jgi:RimJ/RimL family protein N-acetyltransferase
MYVQNHGSYKAFLKAGYQDAGCLKQHFYCQGRFVDARLVEKCREEEK